MSALLLLTLTAVPAASKVTSTTFRSRHSALAAGESESVTALENRLRPYLEHRIRHDAATAQNQLNESDLFLVAKEWSSLSTEFKQLYSEATQIPSRDTFYVSPSGHFEVYYTAKGTDSVPVADNYGFGSSGNWRTKNSGANGVPDYVDEVAWALDSAWSMEIGQFKYIQPIPYTDAAHSSNRFKVVITSMDPGYYGETFPGSRVGTHGFESHIELRNEWSDKAWHGTGYDTTPFNGARVTCAHEFFHTIQYAMAWKVNADGTPDSFPLSFTEGTAVMMEGLAFRSVFDYIQYTYDYFNNPTITMLNPSDSDYYVYTNSLVTKFLHEKYSALPDSDFIHRVFQNDYVNQVDFYPNLHSVSLAAGSNWVDILNAFHTQSYFTGTRAKPGVFIQDAPLLPQWSFSYDVLSAAQKITKQVNSHALQIFAFRPSQVPGDTLYIGFTGDAAAASVTYPSWSASCILEAANGSDSIVDFTFSGNTTASLEIPSWNSFTDAIIIVTNGDISAKRNATISVQTFPFSHLESSVAVFPNPVRIGANAGILFRGKNLLELWIYAINGELIAHDVYGHNDQPGAVTEDPDGFDWRLCAASGSAVSPGVYFARIGYKDPVSSGMKKQVQKMFVLP